MIIQFSDKQIETEKKLLQKKIFYLLLIVDPVTSSQYPGADVEVTYKDLFSDLDGLNELFNYPVEIINIAKKLAKALKEYQSPNFSYRKYRKYVLDAGNEVNKIGR